MRGGGAGLPRSRERLFAPVRWPGADLRWLGRAGLSHRGRLGQPFKLTFAVTDACQSGCEICSIWKKRPENELSVAEIRRIFRSAPRFSWIDLTGGEPFLRGDIAEVALAVIEECPSLGLLHLPTNGLEPDLVVRETMKILSHRPRRLIMTVSIDGPPELNVLLRGHPEAWNAAIETFSRLRHLRSSSFDVLLGITLSDANEEEAGQIFEEARRVLPDLKKSELHWNVAHESSHYYANKGSLGAGDPARLYSLLRKHAGDEEPTVGGLRARLARWHPVAVIDRSYRGHLHSFLMTGQAPVHCKSLRSTAFLDPKGQLFPCITWNRPLGNVRDYDYALTRLWNSEGVAEVADEVAAGRCPQCWTPCEAAPALLGSFPHLIRGAGPSIRG